MWTLVRREEDWPDAIRALLSRRGLNLGDTVTAWPAAFPVLVSVLVWSVLSDTSPHFTYVTVLPDDARRLLAAEAANTGIGDPCDGPV